MSDIFDDVNIATPLPNAVVSSPVHIQASASTNVPVNAMQVYVDNAPKYRVSGPAMKSLNESRPTLYPS